MTTTIEARPEALTPGDVSRAIQIPEETLARWRRMGEGPPFIRVGKHCRYLRTDLEAWLHSKKEAS